MIVIMEDIYDQIMRQNVVRDSYFWKEWLKTTLKVFAFNYLDIDNKQYFLDNEHLNVLRELRNKFAILPPDKGRRIALINLDDLINSIRNIFDDSTKLKKLIKDHAITRLTAGAKYLNTLFKRDEINKFDKKHCDPNLQKIT